MRRISRRTFLGLAGTAGLLAGSLALPASAATADTASHAKPAGRSGPETGIQPMTTVSEASHEGYFSDPYPIHLSGAASRSASQYFSGTTPAVLHCPGRISPGCFTATKISVVPDASLIQDATAHGSRITATQNSNIYQGSSGRWLMATTMSVTNPAYPSHWTVILHARPAGPSSATVPVRWIADSLLVGSFSNPVSANYDGKYFEDAGRLYLIYSKRLSSPPAAENGLVAQLMKSPATTAATAPVVLLKPTTADGGYNSELFFGLNQPYKFKIVETGNITKINGKYVMAYSTGAFDEPDYKVGIAWSDTFLPKPGHYYKKVLKQDSKGVWGQPGHPEVEYLLQSQKSAWPNYVASRVLAPGVPSIVNDGGAWYLYFAGYLPSDAPVLPATGYFDPRYRRPFFMRLKIRVPRGATVGKASPFALGSWITEER